MSKNMDCRIIQDLLPSYVDGLTSEYTNKVVEEHIKSCEPCNQMLQQMQEPEKYEDSTEKEVDYMKKVRNKMHMLSIISSISIIILVILACFMVFNRIVPKNYEDIFVNDEINYFMVSHPMSASQITLEMEDAEELIGMLEDGKYYYEGKEENVIYGDLLWVKAYGNYGQIYYFQITDKNKIYYDAKVYDIRDDKMIFEFLDSKIQEAQSWIDYEKTFYHFLDGEFIMKTEGDITQVARFELDMDTKTYSYLPFAYSSYWEQGTFSIDELTVTLRGDHTFVFQIQDENILSFNAEKSDEIKDISKDEPITTGTKFIKE